MESSLLHDFSFEKYQQKKNSKFFITFRGKKVSLPLPLVRLCCGIPDDPGLC